MELKEPVHSTTAMVRWTGVTHRLSALFYASCSVALQSPGLAAVIAAATKQMRAEWATPRSLQSQFGRTIFIHNLKTARIPFKFHQSLTRGCAQHLPVMEADHCVGFIFQLPYWPQIHL